MMMEKEESLEKIYFKSLFNNAPDSVALVDTDGYICDVNSYFETVFKVKRENIIGQSVIGSTIPVYFHERAIRTFDLILEGERGPFNDVLCVKHDQTTFPCRVSAIPIFSDSEIINAYIIFHDLTEEYERDRQLLYASAVVKESPVVLFRWKTTEGWPIVYVSENVSRWGYIPDYILAGEKSYLDLIYELDRQKVINQVKAHEEAEDEEYEMEYRVVTGDGQIIWVDERTSVFRDDYGKPVYYQGTVADVTARKNAEIALSNNLENVRRAWNQTIEVMALTSEMKDPFSVGHQKRVASLSRAIGEELGLEKEIVDNLEKAALVHDIGKVEIPSELLNKPGPLTDVEFKLVQTHSEVGFIILSRIELPWPLAEIVYQHHERMDGSGYPRGLKGDKILLASRIIGVADVVEAMASHRPYRPSLGIDVALEEIEKLKDTALDLDVVNACIKLFKEKGFSF